MAVWPWLEAVSPINYEECPHCGNTQPVENKRVIVCSCKEARQAELEQRERVAAFSRNRIANRPQGRKAKVQ